MEHLVRVQNERDRRTLGWLRPRTKAVCVDGVVYARSGDAAVQRAPAGAERERRTVAGDDPEDSRVEDRAVASGAWDWRLAAEKASFFCLGSMFIAGTIAIAFDCAKTGNHV